MGRPTDRAVTGAVAAGYSGLVLWSLGVYAADHATAYAWMSPGAATSSLGRLAGLSAGLLMVGLFVLVGRWPPVERVVGQDRLLRWHTAVAIALPFLVVVHAGLVLLGGATLTGQSPLEYTATMVRLSATILAAIGAGLVLTAVAVTSTRWVRRRLRYERWHVLHTSVYVALAAALLHQITVGTDLVRHTTLRAAWTTAVLGVLAGALAFRVVLPVVRSLTAGVRVAGVVQETPKVWSLLLRGDGLAARLGEGGVFCWLRVLHRGTWTEAHPFSVSGVDADGLVRVTFAARGDYTARLTSVRPGTRVVVEGPYGRFRASLARTPGPYLLVGVGSGVGAVVGVLCSLPVNDGPAPVLVQRVRCPEDVLFAAQLGGMADAGRVVHRVVVGSRTQVRTRLDDPDALRELVPDLASREVYVCGPDELADDIVTALRICGVPERLVHSERFALGRRRIAAPLAQPGRTGPDVMPAVLVRPRR